jgi:aristolochene synthase
MVSTQCDDPACLLVLPRLLSVIMSFQTLTSLVTYDRIMCDVWQGLRACDKELADAMLQPCFDFMNSQTDPRRLTKMNLEQYLEYRLDDVGKE